ncbi:MAG: ribosome-recycling factor, partial [Actinomycetota bacterium]
LNPSNDGQVIRLAFPPLNAERRQELVRVVRSQGEEGKVTLRNLRRSARDELKAMEKDGDLSADDLHGAEAQLDTQIHSFEAKIDEALEAKERELLDE